MFFTGQNLKHVHITYSLFELLIFFWLTLVNVFCLEFISRYFNEILYITPTPKETNRERDAKRHTFSLVSDTDIEKSCFSCRVKIAYQQLFLSFCLCDLTVVETLKKVAVVNTAFLFFLRCVRPWIVFNFKIILKHNHFFYLTRINFLLKTQRDRKIASRKIAPNKSPLELGLGLG